ncbi:MAG: hypothetical protein H6851_05135 [Geminicoccaceae bacterium]|nr:hypothetical protein [Geminicoccaceae bacterium]
MTDWLAIAQDMQSSPLSLAAGTPPEAPQSPDWNALARQMAAENLDAAFQRARGSDEERAARVSDISARMGVPYAFSDRNLERIEEREKHNARLRPPPIQQARTLEMFDTPKPQWEPRRIEADAPGFAKWLTKDRNAELSGKEVEALAEESWWLTRLSDDFGTQFAAGVDADTLGELAYRVATGEKLQGAELRLFQDLQVAQLDAPDAQGIAGNIGQVLGSMTPTLGEGVKGALAGGAAGAAVGAVTGPGAAVTATAGAIAGSTAMAAMKSYRVITGQAFLEYAQFRDMKGERIDPTVAKLAAAATGVFGAGFEIVGLGSLSRVLPGLRELPKAGMRKLVAEALRRPGVASLLKDYGRRVAVGTAGEVSTEVAQEAAQILFGEIAKIADEDRFETISGEEAGGRITSTFIDTLKGVGPLAVLTGLPSAAIDARRARRAAQMQRQFEQYGEAASQTNLRRRAPDAHREMVADSLKEGGADSVHVDSGAFMTLFQEGGLDPQEVGRQLGIEDQMATAIENGGDLVIPLATYAEKLAGSTYHKGLAPHLRLSAEDMSGHEAQLWFANLDQQTRDLLAGIEKGDAGPAAESTITDDIRRQLVEAGRTPDVAATEAAVLGSFIETQAQREGLDPAELYRSLGLTIRRELPEGLRGLSDADLDELLGRVRPAREGSDAGREARASGAEGLPTSPATDSTPPSTPEAASAPETALRGFLDELQLDPATVTAADIRNATEPAGAGETLFQPMPKGTDPEQPVPITKARGDHAGQDYWQARKAFRKSERWREIIDGGPYVNEATGFEIAVSGNDLRHAATRDKKRSDDLNSLPRTMPERIEALAVLPELLRHAIPAEPRPAAKGGRQIVNIHRLYAPLETDGAVYTVRLTVREYEAGAAAIDGIDVFKAYDAALEKKLPAGNAASRNLSPSAGTISIREMLAGVKDDDGNPYFQGYGQDKKGDPRGSITFTEGRTLVRLFEKADLSTVLHESGHLFLEVMTKLADRPEASDQLKADLATIREWVGNKGGKWERGQHEQFARGVEAYLFEGKAPSIELQSAFDRFRSWLVRIYRHIAKLDVELNDDVRGVMDRMLATDEQITAAEQASHFAPLLSDQAQSGMTPEEHAAYLAQAEKATRAAKGELLAKAMAQEKQARSAEYRERRDALRAGIAAEVDQLPAYRAIAGLSKGIDDGQGGVRIIRLSRAAVEEDHSRDMVARLAAKAVPPIVSSAGIHPDDAAPLFGYATGDDMMRAILDAPKRSEVIEAEVKRRLDAEFGDMMNDGTIEREASKSAFNDERATFIATELRALSKKAGKDEVTPIGIVRASAKRFVARATVGRVTRAAHHLRAAQKAANEALAAVGKGDWQAATDAKRRQLWHFETWREMARQADRIDATVRSFGKFSKPATRKRIKGNHLDQIDALLERVDLRRGVSMKAVEKRAALADYITEQEEILGFRLDIPQRLRNDAFRQHYKAMSVEEFTGFADAVRQLEHLADLEGKLLARKDRRDFEEVKVGMIESMIEHNDWHEEGPNFAPSAFEKFGTFAKNVDAAHTKVEFIAEQLDGFNRGPVWEAIFKPIADAEAAEMTMQRELSTRLREILSVYSKRERLKWTARRFTAGGRPMNKATILSLALNWGNEGNREAVMRGYGWSRDQVRQMLDEHMDARDWQTVQAIWDMIEELWPQIAAQEKELTGTVPEKVERSKVETAHGTFAGGYYPLVYDEKQNDRVMARAEAEAFGSMTGRAATKKGHTIERVDSGGLPVKLELGVLSQHIAQVSKDLTHRRPVSDVLRIISDKDVREAIEATAGREMYQQLQPWLRHVANAERAPLHIYEKVFGHLREGMAVNAMGWKVSTAIQQPLGILQSTHLLGTGRMIRTLAAFAADPRGMAGKVRAVLDKSEAMRHRQASFDRDVADTLRKMTDTDPLADVRRTFFWFTGVADMLVAVPTWQAAYEKGLKDHKGDEERAVAYADSIVRMSQSAGGAKDLAAVQRGGETWRFFTPFYSYFSVSWNLTRRAMKKTDFKNPRDWPQFAGSMMALWILPSLVAQLMVGRGPEDDEGWLEWAAKNAIPYPLLGLVFVRDVAQGIFSDYGYEMSASARGVEAIAETIRNVAEFDGWTRGEIMTAAEAIGVAFKLPAGQMRITGEGLFDLISGDWKPDDIGELWRHLFLQRRPEAYQ